MPIAKLATHQLSTRIKTTMRRDDAAELLNRHLTIQRETARSQRVRVQTTARAVVAVR